MIGIDSAGKREVLGLTIGDRENGNRENQKAWEDLMDDLKNRGVQQIDHWITDGGKVMINAFENRFSKFKRQRCVKHKMENVLGYTPKKQQERIRPELKAIFYQINREKAEQMAAASIAKYERINPTATDCLRLVY